MQFAVGIDIGGTYIKVVAISPSGEILARSRVATDDSAVSRMPADIRAEISRMEKDLGDAQTVGVACPGLVCKQGDAIRWMRGRLNLLEGLNWTDILQRDRRVPVINDGHAALKAETWLGAGRGCQDVVMLTLGTGVGGAILSDGRVLSGHLGRAGHVGHISLDPTGCMDLVNTPGSLEDAVGNCTVLRRTGGQFATTSELLEAHLIGNQLATDVWLKSVDYLSAGLTSIINLVDPQRIILGGGIAARAGQALFDPLRTRMDVYEWRPVDTPVEIVPAALGDEAGAIGSAKHAMEHHDAN